MGYNGMAFFPSNFMLQTASHEDDDIDHHNSNSLFPILPPCSTHQDFNGVASFLGKGSMPFSSTIINNDNVCDQETNNGHGEDELSDDGSQLVGGEMKKRRLNIEQVRTLERSFELGNKLEPERKMELARALGLHPRQIAIWFQNRRARWKTKQLEKDYDELKAQFDAVKAQNDALQSQNQKLKTEVKYLSQIMTLRNREPTEPNINLNIKETEGSCSNKSENSSEMKLKISTTQTAIDSPSSHHHHHHHQITNLFPPSNNVVAHQLIETSSADCPKLDQTAAVKEESFCNMFVGIEDQSGFWPWLEQPQFN